MPVMVKFYNCYMGGVGLSDQKNSYYDIDFRSRYKYYLRIFFDQINTAITNSFIIKGLLEPNNKSNSKDFRLSIVKGLIGDFSSRKREPQTSSKRKHSFVGTSVLKHLPEIAMKRSRCSHCSSMVNDCRTNIECSTCCVKLCMNSTRNCFLEYHLNL